MPVGTTRRTRAPRSRGLTAINVGRPTWRNHPALPVCHLAELNHTPHTDRSTKKSILPLGSTLGPRKSPFATLSETTDPVLTIDCNRYSGVSWVYSATPDDIHHVAHWPYDGRRSKDEVQIPTQVDLKTNKWGYLVPKDADPVCWFKLLLLKPNDMKSDMKDARMPLQVSQMKLRKHAGYDPGAVVDLIAHFLRQLWEHTLAEIAHEIDVDCLRIKVAITVPAIWPLYARQKMEEAAKKAGILKPRRIGATKLILVEEPEAAAISTLFDRKDHPEIEVCTYLSSCRPGIQTRCLTRSVAWRVLYRLRLWRRHDCRHLLS